MANRVPHVLIRTWYWLWVSSKDDVALSKLIDLFGCIETVEINLGNYFNIEDLFAVTKFLYDKQDDAHGGYVD